MSVVAASVLVDGASPAMRNAARTASANTGPSVTRQPVPTSACSSAAADPSIRSKFGSCPVIKSFGPDLITIQNTEDVTRNFLVWSFTWPLWLFSVGKTSRQPASPPGGPFRRPRGDVVGGSGCVGGEDVGQGHRGQGAVLDQPDDVVVHGGHRGVVGVPDDDVPGPQGVLRVLPDLVGGDLGGIAERAVPPGDHRVALLDADPVGARRAAHVGRPEIRFRGDPVQAGQVSVVPVQLVDQFRVGQGADVGVVPGVVRDLDLPAVHQRLHVLLVLGPGVVDAVSEECQPDTGGPG